MADSEVVFVINNLTKLLQENTNLIDMIQDDVVSLVDNLMELQAFLKDVTKSRSRSRSRSEVLKHLVKVLSAAVYEAENSIDKFLIEVKLHQEKRGILKCLDLSHAVKARHCSAEIKFIREKLREIRRDTAYDLSMSLQYVDPKHSLEVRRTMVSLVEEDDVVGFDYDALEIIKHLCHGSCCLEFIAIVGMPGLGKTTLAKNIFNDPRVKYEFFSRIWVYVSQSYTRRDLFLQIINQLTRNTEQYQYVNEEALAVEVKEHLQRANYLIVLDDIWTIETLDDVKIVLPDNNRGSRVLLTTRDSRLANHCSIMTHHLRFLTQSECWDLLQRKVFHKERCPPDLEEIGQRIAMKCMGLPLAILVVAGILNRRGKTKSEWERVHQGVSEHSTSSDFLMTKNLVQMSYDSLPFNLKVCFLYCGAFPGGFEIPAWKIVRLWIAEGFIGAQRKTNVEKVAEEYLEELVSKNLLIVMQRTSNGQIKTCRMHHMLHDFCTLEAREENFFKEINLGIEQSFPRNQELATFRRLCIDSSIVEFICTKPYGDGIRSFLCFSSQEIMMPPSVLKTITKSFPLLRVLDIEPILFGGSFRILHKQFIQLYHLRYIALSSDSLEILPKFMGNLWNLQTLIICTRQKTLDIQADICNMPQLRHLHTNASAKLRPSAAVKTNEHCALQTLSTIEPESCTEHLLARCQNLKKLGIRGKMAELLLQASGAGAFLKLDKLKRLEKLKLNGYPLAGQKLHLPSENVLPMSLKQVTLSGTMLEWAGMVILEQLPALEVLKLKENAFTGDYWKSKNDGFPCLKVLRIERTDLVTWNASSDVFPCLQRLVIRHLVKLEEVPRELAGIINLKTIELVNTTTTAVESARKIQAEHEHKCGTELKLYISDCN